jgi:hypothetical protein
MCATWAPLPPYVPSTKPLANYGLYFTAPAAPFDAGLISLPPTIQRCPFMRSTLFNVHIVVGQ